MSKTGGVETRGGRPLAGGDGLDNRQHGGFTLADHHAVHRGSGHQEVRRHGARVITANHDHRFREHPADHARKVHGGEVLKASITGYADDAEVLAQSGQIFPDLDEVDFHLGVVMHDFVGG